MGKTTTSINLSSALDWFRREVIVMDANFDNPDIGINLGAELVDKTLHTALRGDHHIKESIYLHPSGLKLIPGCISYEASRMGKRENLPLIMNDLAGAAEVIIVDTTPGLGEDTRTLISAVDHCIIVTTPDLCSVSNSLKMVKLAEELKTNVIGVVVMRVEGDETEIDTKNIEYILKRKVLGSVPADPMIKQAEKHKNPVVFLYPNTIASNEFKKIAASLIGEEYVPHIEEYQNDSTLQLALKAFGLKKY